MEPILIAPFPMLIRIFNPILASSSSANDTGVLNNQAVADLDTDGWSLDENHYPKGRRISNKQMEEVDLHPNPFHGDWNYSILPAIEKP